MLASNCQSTDQVQVSVNVPGSPKAETISQMGNHWFIKYHWFSIQWSAGQTDDSGELDRWMSSNQNQFVRVGIKEVKEGCLRLDPHP